MPSSDPAVPFAPLTSTSLMRRTLRPGWRFVLLLPLLLVLFMAMAPAAQAAQAPAPAPAPQLKDYCSINPAEIEVFGCFLQLTMDPLRKGFVWVIDGMNAEEPDIYSEFFKGNYSLTLQLGILVTIPMVFLATINAVLKGGKKELIHTYLVGLPVSILGAVAALGCAGVLQRIDQRICDWFWPQLNADLQAWMNQVMLFDDQAIASINAIVMMGLMIAMMAMCWGLYNELVFRILMIYLTLLFFPLALAVWVFESTRRWAVFILEFIAVMIFAKAIMIIILAFGFHLIVISMGPNVWADGRGLTYILMGIVMLVMAALSVPALVSFVLQPRHRPQLDRRSFYQNQPLNLGRLQMYQSARAYPRRWGAA